MKKIYLLLVLTFSLSGVAHAQSTRIATIDDLRLLKKDVLVGSIKIGETRLRSINNTYGKPANVNETETRLTYDYGDLRIVFDKKKYLRDWSYDSSKKAVYTNDVEKLRYDLEGQQIAGNFVSYESIRRNYGEPTARMVMDGDGDMSTYYYGTIKLVFENVVEVQSLRGSDLNKSLSGQGASDDGVLGTVMSQEE